MKNVTLQLAAWNSLTTWKPQVGDTVICHGMLTHWFGVVNSVSPSKITVIKAGIPVLLLTMDEAEHSKNQLELNISKIRTSRGGKYAVLQVVSGAQVWYV